MNRPPIRHRELPDIQGLSLIHDGSPQPLAMTEIRYFHRWLNISGWRLAGQ
jgi:hypothetical protein